MSEPEISRRCLECGASIRARAFFCPQCGKAFAREPSEAKPGSDSGEKQVQNAAAVQRETSTPPPAKKGGLSDGADRQSAGAVGAAAERHSRVSVHRAAAAARDVLEDNVMPRVEKLRKASSVVLDEAGYDPSLRFVLVTIVLFVLFLVLLLLSKWLG